jgi:hypothetical protein
MPDFACHMSKTMKVFRKMDEKGDQPKNDVLR